jgi:hypothetical protein
MKGQSQEMSVPAWRRSGSAFQKVSQFISESARDSIGLARYAVNKTLSPEQRINKGREWLTASAAEELLYQLRYAAGGWPRCGESCVALLVPICPQSPRYG